MEDAEENIVEDTTRNTEEEHGNEFAVPETGRYQSEVDIWEKLKSAIDTGDDEEVEALLKNKLDPRDLSKCRWGYPNDEDLLSPLMFAAHSGHLKIVKLLLDNGADIFSQTKVWKSTALSLNCWVGREEVIRVLVKHGGKKLLEMRGEDGMTTLIRSACWNTFSIVKMLAELGANINKQDHDGKTTLHWTVEKGETDYVKYLLSKGADLNLRTNDGRNLLHFAAMDDPQMTQYLLYKGAKIEPDKIGRTSLHNACYGGHEDLVQILLNSLSKKQKQVIIAKDDSGDTALSDAASTANISIVLRLLETEVYFPKSPVTDEPHFSDENESERVNTLLLRGVGKWKGFLVKN